MVSSGLLLGAVLTRLVLRRRLALERRAAAFWNPVLAQCAAELPSSLPRIRRRDARRFLALWCHAQESLRGLAQERLRALARRLGAETHARRLLGSNMLQRRMLGVVSLGHLGARDFMPMLAAQVSFAPTLVSLVAAKALVRIDAASGIDWVLTAAAKREDWPTASVANIVRECEPELVGPALSTAIHRGLAEGCRASSLVRLLQLHGAAHRAALRDAVLATLSSAAGAEALAAALAILWHPGDAGHARSLLEHPEWFVRVAAARALGRLGVADDAPHLIDRLADNSWWVRYRAAQALCGLPGADAAALEALVGRLPDQFARDILRHALAERISP
jgi:hypothetical protein